MSATTVERLREFRGNDLQDLCEAAEEGIKAGGGFGWLKPPHRPVMESYWRGVMLIPDRHAVRGPARWRHRRHGPAGAAGQEQRGAGAHRPR